MFVTSILKLMNSTYLSGSFLLKGDCFKAGLLHLCLYTSLGLAVFVPDMGPATASLIAITAALAGWIAAWVTAK